MKLSTRIKNRTLDLEERSTLERLLDALAAHNYTQDSVFNDLDEVTERLPPNLLSDLGRFATGGTDLVLRIEGIPQGRIHELPTPSAHGDSNHQLLEDHVLYLAIVNAVGYSVGFSTQQGGRVVNDIMPIKGREAVQNSSNGSMHHFGFHTEDAFHEQPPPFFSLYCVRNETGPGITLGAIDQEHFPTQLSAALRQEVYRVFPNPSQEQWRGVFNGSHSILFGSAEDPSFRFNSADTQPSNPKDAQTREALERFDAHLASNSFTVEASPGDLVIVRNDRVAHAREAYAPRYDGRDRWLLRLVSYKSLQELSQPWQTLTGRIITPTPVQSQQTIEPEPEGDDV